MKRLSLQWRITLMTALLICSTCVLMNCLVGYSGMRYMDSIGAEASAHNKVETAAPSSFDPASKELDDELTIVVSDAQASFGATSWCITAAVTLLGGVLAYFVSGHALRPLRSFAAQVESVRPDNLADTKISEDVPSELRRCSASFNDMIPALTRDYPHKDSLRAMRRTSCARRSRSCKPRLSCFALSTPTPMPIQRACSGCCRSRPSE